MRIGIDFGGTKIEGVALGDAGEVMARHRVPTPRGDYVESLRTGVDLVAYLEKTTGAVGSVGIGIPGTVSPATGLVKNANSTWLIGSRLAEDLERALGRPVRLANDANCFALSEATDGAAVGAPVVFGVIIGTGTGGGIVCNGRVLSGANALAGEWGHNPLPNLSVDERPGPACYCGRFGCIETFLSGPGLSRDYATETTGRPLLGGSHDAVLRTGVPAADIAARSEAGEPAAMATLERYEERLARALGTVINILDPDVIVLGGGLSNIERLYQNVPARWSGYVFSDRVDTALVRARHGDASGARGAAWLWERHELPVK